MMFSTHTHKHTRYNVTRRHMDELCDSIIALGYQFILIDCPAGARLVHTVF